MPSFCVIAGGCNYLSTSNKIRHCIDSAGPVAVPAGPDPLLLGSSCLGDKIIIAIIISNKNEKTQARYRSQKDKNKMYKQNNSKDELKKVLALDTSCLLASII